MPVLRSHRTYPLALTADPLNTGIVGAYDWAGDPANSWAGGAGADHSGAGRNITAATIEPARVLAIGGEVGLNGLDYSVGLTQTTNYARCAGVAALGMDGVGSGDYTIWLRVRMPSAAPSVTRQWNFAQYRDTANRCSVGIFEVTATGKYHIIAGSGPAIVYTDGGANNSFAPGQVVDVHIRRLSGTVSTFVNGILIESTADASVWTTGGTAQACWWGANGASSRDSVLIDAIHWTRGLSNAEVTAHQSNPYSYYANAAPPDSITVDAPLASATVGTNISISGTYAGAGAPTAIEASFNGSAYQTIDASPSGGTFAGTFTGATPGTGTLTVRWANSTGVADTVADVTVTTAAIAFTAPPTTVDGAVAHRTFQRNAANQAAARITGTYIGTPASIQYRWAAGPWGTLVATPAGGTFDATVTLTGPGQGALEVRFGDNPSVTAALANVAVGDVYIVAGQSNHIGVSPVYVPPVAPGANPGWIACEFDKTDAWRPNVESVDTKFDTGPTGSPYPIYTGGAQGSYFGRLATRIMAAGVPVAFVPCAKGSTTISSWSTGGALYEAMLDRTAIVGAHKAVLWWQGESDAGSGSGITQAAYESALTAIIDHWWTAHGTPWLICNINDQGSSGVTEVRAALAAVAANHAHAFGPADMLGAWGGGNVHYDSAPAIDEVSLRAFVELHGAGTVAIAEIEDAASVVGAVGSIGASGPVAAMEAQDIAAVVGEAGGATARTLTLTLYEEDGITPAANKTGISLAFWPVATPGAVSGPPELTLIGQSTNAAGLLSLSVSTVLPSGGVGLLALSNSNGSPGQAEFNGTLVPVAVI